MKEKVSKKICSFCKYMEGWSEYECRKITEKFKNKCSVNKRYTNAILKLMKKDT